MPLMNLTLSRQWCQNGVLLALLLNLGIEKNHMQQGLESREARRVHSSVYREDDKYYVGP